MSLLTLQSYQIAARFLSHGTYSIAHKTGYQIRDDIYMILARNTTIRKSSLTQSSSNLTELVEQSAHQGLLHQLGI
jgi:hypothetical protein